MDAVGGGARDQGIGVVGVGGGRPDGIDNSSARAEAKEVLEHLVEDLPEDWTADTITIYRFWSADWDAKYWPTQEWIPIASWRLTK